MGSNETGQISANAAENYEEFYIPALFKEWSPRVIEAEQELAGFLTSEGMVAFSAPAHIVTANKPAVAD